MERAILDELQRLKETGEPAVLVTVVRARGSTPRKAGARMIVRSDGTLAGTVGGGRMEAMILAEAPKILAAGTPRFLQYALTPEGEGIGAVCGGTMELFAEPVQSEERLIIFGGGHVAWALSKMGALMGFEVHIVEDRPEWANAERFPEARQIWAGDPKGVIPRLPLDHRSFVVLVTHSWTLEAEFLPVLLPRPWAYLGMIGSARKVAETFAKVRAAGASQALLDKCHAPVGLDIGAYTPAECAVSILAEIIAVRAGKRGQLPGWPHGDVAKSLNGTKSSKKTNASGAAPKGSSHLKEEGGPRSKGRPKSRGRTPVTPRRRS